MPVYEYRCNDCQCKMALFLRGFSAPKDVVCHKCGSTNLVRIISSFAYHKSLKTIHEEAGEPLRFPGPDYYKDPRNIGRWTEKRFKEMDMEMPAQAQEMIDAAREGELPPALKDI